MIDGRAEAPERRQNRTSAVDRIGSMGAQLSVAAEPLDPSAGQRNTDSDHAGRSYPGWHVKTRGRRV